MIFGSSHPLGIEKFLKLCWEKDPVRGEANFDIDGEKIDTARPSLFPELDIPKKLSLFQQELRENIISGTLTTDSEVYTSTLESGFLPSVGRQVLRKLIKSGKVRCVGGQPRVSGEGYKQPRNLEILA